MDHRESDKENPRLSPAARLFFADLARLDEYCRSVPDTYAGRWNDGGTSFAIAFTGDIEVHAEALNRILHSPERVRFVKLRYSYRHLQELCDRIPSIVGKANGLVGYWPDVRDNCVVVRVLPEHLDEVRRILALANEHDVRVVAGQPAHKTRA